MSIRDDLAAALSTVDGVKGYAYRPGAVKPGDAWPLLTSYDRADGFVYMVTWRVQILLPADERAASDWFDAHTQALVEALEPLAFVDRLEPVTLQANNSEQNAMQITLRRE